MPALTSYSPYETLVFVQNVIQYGTDAPAFQEISTALTQNQLIRENVDSDVSKFSPDALQHLYERVVDAQREEKLSLVNGDTETPNPNPRKRKLSPSPAPKQKQDTEEFLQELVNTLYAQFRDETTRELREQEQEYERLQSEIKRLDEDIKVEQADAAQKTQAVKDQPIDAPQSSSAKPESKADPVSLQLQATLEAVNQDAKTSPPSSARLQTHQQGNILPPHDRPHQSPVQNHEAPTSRSASGTPHARPAQPPQLPLPTSHTSPGTFNRNLPPPSPQHPNHGAFQPPPHTFLYPPQGVGQPPILPPILPPIHNMQRPPSHEAYPQHQTAPNQGHLSPMPQQLQQPYQVFSQYQQPSPNGWQSPIPQQYQPQYNGAPQHYHPQQPARYGHVQTPIQPPYQSHPHTAPISYPNQQQWRGPPPYQYPAYSASATTTPVPRSNSRTPIVRSASSTPWKNRLTPGLVRPRSPSRLQREISPLSDHGSSPPVSPKRRANKPTKADHTAKLKAARRETSATPVLHTSRSQSVMSNVSEPPEPPKRRVGRPPKIKAETPSTPAPVVSDSEQQQRSSGRRGRHRASTLTKKSDAVQTTVTAKRKRDAHSPSPVSALPSPTHRPPVIQHVDPNLVMVSKTFGRTSQLLISEITSHKLAGIFAKPLSERDAPGYKSLIHRPQDLKSLKAAISKGSRVAIAAIEEIETRLSTGETIGDADQKEATPTPAPKTNPSATSKAGEGPIGNGFYLVRTNEDLVPPKGIVNSAQLEMELVRMFANAVMFNPLSASERGFGRLLRLRKRGGEPRTHTSHIAATLSSGENGDDEDNEDQKARFQRKDNRDASEPATTITTTTSESEISGSSVDEGGIIADAREMFEDVERQVAKWKEVEGDRLVGHGHGGGASFSTPFLGPGQNQGDRHGSIGASSAAAGEHDDDNNNNNSNNNNERDVTPAGGGLGSMRKRRRIGDH